MSDLPAPFDACRDHARPEWIDHNGRMNMGYCLVVFDYSDNGRFVSMSNRPRRVPRWLD